MRFKFFCAGRGNKLRSRRGRSIKKFVYRQSWARDRVCVCASDDALQDVDGRSSQLTRRYSFDIILSLLYIIWYVMRGDMTAGSRPRREETMTSLARTMDFFSVWKC